MNYKTFAEALKIDQKIAHKAGKFIVTATLTPTDQIMLQLLAPTDASPYYPEIIRSVHIADSRDAFAKYDAAVAWCDAKQAEYVAAALAATVANDDPDMTDDAAEQGGEHTSDPNVDRILVYASFAGLVLAGAYAYLAGFAI